MESKKPKTLIPLPEIAAAYFAAAMPATSRRLAHVSHRMRWSTTKVATI
jgi:hypothetical protein